MMYFPANSKRQKINIDEACIKIVEKNFTANTIRNVLMLIVYLYFI